MLRSRAEIVIEAFKYRLPVFGDSGFFAVAGALASYTNYGPAGDRRVASFVDRILRGAKPGDLPVELASIFGLVLNVKTANALDLRIPESVLLRANVVIR